MRGEDARGTEGVSGREARLWICGALVLEAGLGRGLEGHKACPAWVLQIWVGRGGGFQGHFLGARDSQVPMVVGGCWREYSPL